MIMSIQWKSITSDHVDKIKIDKKYSVHVGVGVVRMRLCVIVFILCSLIVIATLENTVSNLAVVIY